MTDVMQKADDNAEEALGELKSAQNYQKKAGKCQRCLIWIVLLALITAGIIIYTVIIKPNQDDSKDGKKDSNSTDNIVDRSQLLEESRI